MLEFRSIVEVGEYEQESFFSRGTFNQVLVSFCFNLPFPVSSNESSEVFCVKLDFRII